MSDDDSITEFNANDDIDYYLSTIVSIVNSLEGGISFGITVFVNGLIINGTLISGKTYFERISEIPFKSNEPEIAESIRDAFLFPAKIYEKDNLSETTVFFHMENVKIFDQKGNKIPSGDGFLWRGKLSSVDGFSFGSLSTH